MVRTIWPRESLSVTRIMNMATKMEGRSAIVTGAAGGIGRAACLQLAANGWNVLAVDRDADRLTFNRESGNIVTHSGDISIEAENREMVAHAEKAFGGLDSALFVAGISCGGTIDSVTIEQYQKAVSINLIGTVMGIKVAVPALRRRGGGALLLTSSMMGLGGEAGNWAYSSTKHALVGLVYSLARELGHEKIRVNAICPGTTRSTGLTEAVERDSPAAYSALARATPLQRWAEPEEMATVMEFLVSPASSYVNGVAMPVDGGAFVGTGLLPPYAAAEILSLIHI